jgi:hypothetical protein
MLAPPLQLIDSFLLNYNVGDVLLLSFVVGAVGVLPTRSLRLLGLHTVGVGVVLLILPTGMMEPSASSLLTSAFQYKLFGLVLLVVAPVLFSLGRR